MTQLADTKMHGYCVYGKVSPEKIGSKLLNVGICAHILWNPYTTTYVCVTLDNAV